MIHDPSSVIPGVQTIHDLLPLFGNTLGQKTPPHRRSLRRLLASIPSFRLVRFPRRPGVESDEMSSDEVGDGGEGGQEEEDDDEDDDEEDGGGGYWAGGDLMNDEGGEERGEVVDEGDDGERKEDDEEEKEEKEEGPGGERLAMVSEPVAGVAFRCAPLSFRAWRSRLGVFLLAPRLVVTDQ